MLVDQSRRSFSPHFLQLVLLLTLLWTACSRPQETVSGRPSVLLLVLDTLRANHMSVYGYHRKTSPALDQLARQNVLFEYAVSVAPWTPPSLATIFTGLYPGTHRMMPPDDWHQAKQQSCLLDPNLETLAEVFQKYGYRTVGITSNPWTSKSFNYHQGFGDYTYIDQATADQITDRGIGVLQDWLQAAPHQRVPFFLYLHYLDPHDPYAAPKPYSDMFRGGRPGSFPYSRSMTDHRDQYDGEIRFLDQQLGRLFDFLSHRGVYDDLIILVIGDHGEQFSERGNHGHGFQLYNEEIHVPMILKTHRLQDRQLCISQTVSQIDIFPTLLELAQIQVPPSYPGRNLTMPEDLRAREGVLSEIRRKYDQRAFVDSRGRKIILEVDHEEAGSSWESSHRRWQGGGRLVGVFDRLYGYDEKQSLVRPELTNELLEQFRKSFEQLQPQTPSPPEPSEIKQTMDRLRSLGYVE